MRLFIGVITDNADLRRFVGRSKDALVPEDFRTGPNAFVGSVAAAAWDPRSGSSSDLAEFVLDQVQSADGVILLVSQPRISLIDTFAKASHVVRFADKDVGKSVQNFVQMRVAAGLRNFRRLAAMINRGDDGKLLQLPIRNFIAPELREIARLVVEQGADRELAGAVEAQMVRLRKRVRPRKRSDHKITYAVDDDAKLFRYGHERHGSFARGGQHNAACELQGDFRFGHRIDCERHYNVSTGEGDNTSIAGDFLNCHDEVETFASQSHLNMFANDNIR